MATRTLPEEFTAMLSSLGLDGLAAALADGEPCTSVRLNLSKGVTESEPDFRGNPVGWCEGGLYLDERPRFTFAPSCIRVATMFRKHPRCSMPTSLGN
ncbi:MAG: hypothetical protein K2K65_02970 [Duncaniella sp.]|nr:hypothetical protein [Duncaniella sp.]